MKAEVGKSETLLIAANYIQQLPGILQNLVEECVLFSIPTRISRRMQETRGGVYSYLFQGSFRRFSPPRIYCMYYSTHTTVSAAISTCLAMNEGTIREDRYMCSKLFFFAIIYCVVSYNFCSITIQQYQPVYLGVREEVRGNRNSCSALSLQLFFRS